MDAASTESPNDQSIDEAAAEALVAQALNQGLETFPWDRDLEPGEKAEDAVDYEDVSDNDLPDELEEERNGAADIALPESNRDPSRSEHSLSKSADIVPDVKEHEDLFGDYDQPTTMEPVGQLEALLPSRTDVQPTSPDLGLSREEGDNTSHVASPALQMQRELFARSKAAFTNEMLPEPPKTDQEYLRALWPNFEKGAVPRFMDLLPPKKARFASREILKLPRPLSATKLALDIERAQEKLFRAPLDSKKRVWQSSDRAVIVTSTVDESSEDGETDSITSSSVSSPGHESDLPFQDLQMICEDWDSPGSSDSDLRAETMDRCSGIALSTAQPRAPRRSLGRHSLHDPEHMTRHLAKRVKLDLNDPQMLIDASEATTGAHRHEHAGQVGAVTLHRNVRQKYNISNDDAYNLLRENHQSKVRQTLGNLQVDHSMPALRLQWPFFKTRLDKRDARSFHRNPLKTDREPISFSRSITVKRKYTKGKDAQTLFAQSSDLSLNDNSNALLLEYSEEHPMILSNLGMASKFVNHYRKQHSEDTVRPKRNVGELNVLLPQDKSPLTIFGNVEAGQVTSAIHNGMYRAPVFSHDAKNTDFLITRTTTGINGSSWYLRNVENLHVVGQEFPSVDVPGPHSRKVTTASKNRLRMISYRMARRNKSHRISVSEVTKHFIDSTDMQNRQKMKEFMQFDKDYKEWKMRSGESIPEEDVVRNMVKPEDVCLLESMQMGQQHLLDAGLSKDDDEDASEGEDTKEGENIEQQLAPWFTSRNFLNAAQGKAMLQLHGEGDPSGRGEAFSLLKTSMKGGFRAIGESVADKIKKKDLKEKNSRQYNVNEQQIAYEDFIRRVWDAQKRSLSTTLEQSESDNEEDYSEHNDDQGRNPDDLSRSEGRSLTSLRLQEDESASQSTKWSSNSQSGKILEIVRVERNRWGEDEEVRDICRNPRIIRQYMRRRRALVTATEEILDLKPGDDPEENKRREQRLRKEHERLVRNKERRIAREKQKGLSTDGAMEIDGSPTSTGPATNKAGATQRKCANCGMAGHIKTNKKLCPMLNGTRKPEEGYSTSAFTSGAAAF